MKPSQVDQRLIIFVGSSHEASDYYERVCGTLEEQGHDVRGWKSSFDKGEGFLAALLRMSQGVDAALLIATPDDVLHCRGEQSHVLRDNVLFEAGLFIGSLGPLATGIVVAGSDPIKLPTDLSGISTFTFCDGHENAFARDVRRWAGKLLLTQSKSLLVRDIASRIQSIPSPSFGVTKRLLIPRIGTLLTQASRPYVSVIYKAI